MKSYAIKFCTVFHRPLELIYAQAGASVQVGLEASLFSTDVSILWQRWGLGKYAVSMFLISLES